MMMDASARDKRCNEGTWTVEMHRMARTVEMHHVTVTEFSEAHSTHVRGSIRILSHY